MEGLNKVQEMYRDSLKCLFQAKNRRDDSGYQYHYIESLTLHNVLKFAFSVPVDELTARWEAIREEILLVK